MEIQSQLQSLPILGEASINLLIKQQYETTLFAVPEIALSVLLEFRKGRGVGLVPKYKVTVQGVLVLGTWKLDEAIREYNIRISAGLGGIAEGFSSQHLRIREGSKVDGPMTFTYKE